LLTNQKYRCLIDNEKLATTKNIVHLADGSKPYMIVINKHSGNPKAYHFLLPYLPYTNRLQILGYDKGSYLQLLL